MDHYPGVKLRLFFKITPMFLALLFLGSSIALGRSGESLPEDPVYQIISQTNQELVIRFNFPDPVLQDLDVAAVNIKSFQIPGLSFNYIDDKPLLPVLSLPLTLPEGEISTRITITESRLYRGQYPINFHDQPNTPLKGKEGKPRAKDAPGLTAFTRTYPVQIFELEEIGLFRDYKISSLRVFPLQVTAAGVKFFKSFTLTVRFSGQRPRFSSMPSGESKILEKLVVNKDQLGLAVHQQFSPPPTSPPPFSNPLSTATRIRLIVDQPGIYQITGDDLLAAGIDITTIPPSSLRLTNKGNEVAYYLVGDRDGIFDPEDFFEFWGEPNQKTLLDQFADQYSDPFSDENVYWLEWGGNPSIRMVEENGSIVTSRPGEFNPSFFYPFTIHVEENRQFERLGHGSLEKLSYTRDLWFFDQGVKAIGKKQYPFTLIYPDETSFNNVIVEVMFSGKSFGQTFTSGGVTRRVPHDVMVWLNNAFVGQSAPNWFDQDTSRISNRNNSTIRNTDLVHGQNTLEVQLPTLPDVGSDSAITKGTDIVLLNWFNVTYDRLYKAYQNKIEFRRPSFIPYPNVNLFQFDIEGFTRPDIEIYKKGVSKIVNFRIDTEQIDNRTVYKITFQDNVPSDGVEYIALTADQKKKPVRIEQDEPFDPENPQRILRDPGNSAELLIITHDRFYDNVLRLRDYRRSQGVSVELVNVQDIYDEFNFGIKSPLAIQEFLRYAFFNWDRNQRLKFVLLFGDANLNYKTKSQVAADFVPTFFYQTQEFGATSTDLPYALVSGNDQIPDLFIGRIPANSNSDVNNAINKIIEYEQNAPVSSWRNQSLFISGNDSRTFELPGQLGTQNHAFRAQNTRVIASLLPKQHSAKRLNTIRDESIPPGQIDPNFGNDTDLIDHWDDGLFLINFMGHGGGGIWADVGLMGLNDVDRLNNRGMYPIVTSMTCFTGAFENPSNLGLAQKLVLAPEKGAIGVYASSGLGYLHNDYSMLWNIGQFLFDSSLRMGEVVALGKILYASVGGLYNVDGVNWNTPGYGFVKNEMMFQYNLIGDPYLQLQHTPETLQLTANTTTPQRGDIVEITLQTDLSLADGYIELADYQYNIVDRVPLFAVNQQAVIQVPIPEDFPEGTGIIRAYLSDNTRDSGGKIAIGVNHAVIDSITFIPERPGVDDSVEVRFTVKDVNGVQRVFATVPVRVGLIDTVLASQVDGSNHRYGFTLPPTGQLKTVLFNIHAVNLVGNESVFPNISYTVTDIRPDIGLIPGTMRFTGRQRTQLKVELDNRAGAGEDGQVHFFVDFYDRTQASNSAPFVTGEAILGALDSTSVVVDFPLALNQGQFRIAAKVRIDSLEDVRDFNPANDSLVQPLKPVIFNVTPGAGSDTINVAGVYQVYFPAGSIDQPSAVRVELQEIQPPQDQPAILPVGLLDASTYHALRVQLLNPIANLTAPFFFRANLNPAFIDSTKYQISDVKLYQKIADRQPWTFTSAVGNPGAATLTASLDQSALFAPFLSDDAKAPRIELTADGLPLQSRGLVSTNPSLYVIIEDESGINLQKDKISLQLDGDNLPENKVLIPDSVQQNNVLGITLFPELSQGSHELVVTAQDVNGNNAQASFQLQVSDGFNLIVYGNYPNPFSDQTIFSYFVDLNDDLDEFEIRIYTVSGRLIRVIDSDINNPIDAIDGGARRKGYNELIWDGRDKNGNEVANGLYFAVIRASYEGEIKEETLKVAKLR